MNENMDEASRRYLRVRRDLRRVRNLITGNGKPEEGLLSRVGQLERMAKAIMKLLWIVVGAAVGVFVVSLLRLLAQAS